MAHSENNTLSSAFKTFFERETLTGPNFNDWYRSLRIVLRVANTFDYLYKPCPGQPADTATEAEKATFKAEYKKHYDVACIMLGKMSPALQRQQTPGKPVSEHVLEMKGLMDQLHTLGKPYDNDMAVNLINRSLNKDFGDFVRNFNMHCVGKTVTELHALLIDFKRVMKDIAPTHPRFKDARKLSYGDQISCRGNGTQAAVETIGIDTQRKLRFYFYFPPENKVTVAMYGDFLKEILISQESVGRDYDLEDDHMDTLPSENTSEIPVEPESLGPPSELIPVRRSERTKRAPNHLCLNMEVEDDVVRDLGEPADYQTPCLTLISIMARCNDRK
ncbi:hypothetical protein Tco_1474915 [Tanacetum coccineum]